MFGTVIPKTPGRLLLGSSRCQDSLEAKSSLRVLRLFKAMSCSFGDGLWYTGSLGRMFAGTKLQYYTLVLMYYYWRVLQFNSNPIFFGLCLLVYIS